MKWKIFKKESVTIAFAILTSWLNLVPSAGASEMEAVTVFAAASTTNAITDIAKLFMGQHKDRVRISFASSSTLAKQIDNGAPADVFISANKKWMDYLESHKMIIPKSRVDLLGNRIVLIVPAESRLEHIEIKPDFPLVDFLADGRLAMGDPEHVPAGIYGREALMRLHVWESVKSRIAGMKDVRAALVMVERSEVPLGLVYSTDAAISGKVRIVGSFPPETHSPIVYPAGIVANRTTPAVVRFMAFLESPAAKTVFEQYGFSVR
jgi:molybdate transport system substrate-binding protein